MNMAIDHNGSIQLRICLLEVFITGIGRRRTPQIPWARMYYGKSVAQLNSWKDFEPSQPLIAEPHSRRCN
jgi:hypothetical protein